MVTSDAQTLPVRWRVEHGELRIVPSRYFMTPDIRVADHGDSLAGRSVLRHDVQVTDSTGRVRQQVTRRPVVMMRRDCPMLGAEEERLLSQALADFTADRSVLDLDPMTMGPTGLGRDSSLVRLLSVHIAPALFAAYDSINAWPARLERPLAIAGKTVRFRGPYPPQPAPEPYHVFHVSRAAMNATSDSAIVSVAHWCGLICGSYQVHLYVRRGTAWRRAAGIAGGHS